MLTVEAEQPWGGQVLGRPVVGLEPPPPGTSVWLVRRHARALRRRITASQALADGRVRLGLDGWGHEPLGPGQGLATDPALLEPWPAPPPELAVDRYLDYGGPPLPYTWREWGEGVDGDVVVELERRPTQEERASLERALRAWSNDGVDPGFGSGHLHGFYTGAPFGRRWRGRRLRWQMDFGSANPEQAADEVARRLAGWSVHWRLPITSLRFGRD